MNTENEKPEVDQETQEMFEAIGHGLALGVACAVLTVVGLVVGGKINDAVLGR
jgi:hypothetical protein